MTDEPRGDEPWADDQPAAWPDGPDVGPDVVPGVAHLNRLNDLDDLAHVSDTANGATFVGLFRRLVRYDPGERVWYVWDGVSWSPDGEDAPRVFALTQGVIRCLRERVGELAGDEDAERRWLGQVLACEATPRRRAMLAVARTDARLHLDGSNLDDRPSDLVCPNGTVDLETGELRASRPEDLNSRCCAVNYDPDPRAGEGSRELDRFLETFLPDEDDQRFVFAVLGQALRGGNEARVFPIFIGATTSGKSQLFAAVHSILGPYACTIGSSVFRGNLDDRPRPDLVRAMHTRLAYATEAAKNWALHADQVKRLTGGDQLPYRNLYREVVNQTPRFTPVLVTNELPRITGADPATKRRIIVITLERSLPPELVDPRIKRRFVTDPDCRRALLARLVAGARDPLAASVTRMPAKYVLATQLAHGELDHVDEFIGWLVDEEILRVAPADTPVVRCVKASDMHRWYVSWIMTHGDRLDRQDALSLRGLGEALRARGWEARTSAGVRWLGRVLSNHGLPDAYSGKQPGYNGDGDGWL